MKIALIILILFSASLSEQSDGWLQTELLQAHVRPKVRIIGGDEVQPHSIPYQAGLRINGFQYFCGGALISENYVITAAHCAIVMRTVDVILGAHNITDSEEATQITILGENIIIHEDYNDTSYLNDVALIKLSQKVAYSDYIQPVKLPSSSNVVYDYQVAKATGWGLAKDVTYPSTRDMSPVLMGVDVATTNMTDCFEYYNDEEETWVTSGNICTSGYKNKGTCGGDSGGPLVLDGVLIGITSFGTVLCELCSPSVYTKVDYY